MSSAYGLGFTSDTDQAIFRDYSWSDHRFRNINGIGDFNNDGLYDFALTFQPTVSRFEPIPYHEVRTTIVYGSSDRLAGLVSLDDAASAVITGARSVTKAGDVNGDGLSDLLIQSYDDRIGVLFNTGTDLPASFSFDDINGENGFVIVGQPRNVSPVVAAAAGDTNGDGFDDIVIGVPWGGPEPYKFYSGATYVVYGAASPVDAPTSLATLDGANGYRIDGGYPAYLRPAHFGYAVAALDINGDSLSDVIAGAPNDDENATGAVYVILGKNDKRPPVSSVEDLSPPIIMQFPHVGIGYKLASAGDFNGDGFEDFIVGSRILDGNGEGIWRTNAFLVFGGVDGVSGEPDAPYPNRSNFLLDGVNGFEITSSNFFDGLSMSVSGGGDVNGDGFDDIIVGAPNNITITSDWWQNHEEDFRDGIGAAYVIFGTAASMPAQVDVSNMPDDAGFRLFGETPWDGVGSQVAIIGDVDGDGFDDMLIGAPGARSQIGDGATYLVYGAGTGGGAGALLTTEITVFAAGTGETGDAPAFDVLADGRLIGSATISNPIDVATRRAGGLEHDAYRFFAVSDAPPQTVEIVYHNNGVTVSGVDKNLYVDRIEVGGAIFEAEIDGRVTPLSGKGPGIASESMVRNGTMSFDLASELDKVIIVHAGGSGGPVSAPKFRLFVDGELVGAAVIESPQGKASVREDGWRTDVFAFVLTDSKRPETVEIVFDNNGFDPVSLEDLNLHIDAIEVEGIRMESEDAGWFSPSNGIVDREGFRDTLYWNGSLTFDIT